MKCHGLKQRDMFVDSWIHEFSIMERTMSSFKYFAGILNLWIALLTHYTKLNVQQIKMISQ